MSDWEAAVRALIECAAGIARPGSELARRVKAARRALAARAALASPEPPVGYTGEGTLTAKPDGTATLSPEPLDWRGAVVAVVDACDTELDGGGADDFERGADAAYNWVLAVIPGEVLAAARARLSEDSR